MARVEIRARAQAGKGVAREAAKACRLVLLPRLGASLRGRGEARRIGGERGYGLDGDVRLEAGVIQDREQPLSKPIERGNWPPPRRNDLSDGRMLPQGRVEGVHH